LTLTDYVAFLGVNCKGDGEEMSSSLVEVEATLAKCTLLLVGFDRKERLLGKRIVRYCMLIGRMGKDHVQIEIGCLIDEPPSQQWQPGESNSNGGGQEGHCRPLRSVVHQNSNNEDVGNVHNIEGGKHHNCILLLPSDSNSVALITKQSATKAKDKFWPY
jgi:hypothetical protein